MGAAGFVAMAALSIAESQKQAKALREQGDYQAMIADRNASFANAQAADALDRGEKNVSQLKTNIKKIRGSQRVALAAQGLDIETGSSRDIEEDTYYQARNDIITIRNNAWREAWGFNTQAEDIRLQRDLNLSSAKTAADATVLSGGIRALGYGISAYDSYSKSDAGYKKKPTTKNS